MARRSEISAFPPKSQSPLTQPVALVAGLAFVAGSLLFAVPAFGAGGSSDTAHDSVVVCDSGVVSNGDVRTSSAVAVRVPDGASVTVPGGCRVR